jgi:FlaA1/EpsC-like NDP-sugar epimerase
MNGWISDIWLERVCQAAAVYLAAAMAFLLRFDFSVPADLVPMVKQAAFVAVLMKLPVFEFAGFYRGLRRFVSIPDLRLVLLGNFAASCGFAAASLLWFGSRMPRSVLVLDAVLCFLATAFVRFFVRIRDEAFRSGTGPHRTGILIYGAGAAGAELVREIHANRSSRYIVRGFLDDDPFKRHGVVLGLPVLGAGRDAAAVVKRLNRHKPMVDEIIIAMRSVSGRHMREVLANCRAAGIPCKTLPGIDEFLSGSLLAAHVRNVSVDDLLGRKLVRLDDAPIRTSIAGRSVLITGAAGSIGSEICRQVARFGPACLVAFDKAESDLFRIESELRENFPEVELITALGDIGDAARVSEVIERARVESIFHAAAYKHVPMMESHVIEAVRNNVIGTWNLLSIAREQGARNFLMISSDKAVQPACIMGATKRACERLVSAGQPGCDTRSVSVRFGNVLGSNGSVVPIFQGQIAAGGPVKVTHPDARRFFMTVSEAVSLTLQASARSLGAEIFVLDMGEPIRIVDLAENMIRLAGKVPYEDIDIQFTGLRPGEKLIEEVNGCNEHVLATSEEKMRVIRDEPAAWDTVSSWIDELQELILDRNESAIISHVRRFVPEYEPGSLLANATTVACTIRQARHGFPICRKRSNNGTSSNGTSNNGHNGTTSGSKSQPFIVFEH